MWFPHLPQSPMSVNGSRSRNAINMPLSVALPVHPGGPQMAGTSPVAGLGENGIPVGQTPGGNPMLFAGGGAGPGGPMMPPNIAGMPGMPGLPGWMFSGQMPPVGGFEPAQVVAPFDPSNQVQQYQQMEQRQG